MPKGDAWIKELDKRLKSNVFKGTRPDLERIRFDLLDGDDMDRWLDRAEGVLIKDRDFGTGKWAPSSSTNSRPAPIPISPAQAAPNAPPRPAPQLLPHLPHRRGRRPRTTRYARPRSSLAARAAPDARRGVSEVRRV
jgi:hypothetical protein